jgi:hypothetical protein
MASPSLRNSGLETIVKYFFFFFKIFSIESPVPIGTVDFVTIIFFFLVYLRISFVHLYTYDKSTFKEPFFVGVPTQINIISDDFIASLISVVKSKSFRQKKFFLSSSSNPGS